MAWQKCWANATGCVITAPAATKPKTQRAQTWPPGRRATTARQCRVPQRPRATRCPLNNIANAPKPSARTPACCRAPDSKLSRRHSATGRAINAGLELLRTRKCKNRCNNRSPPQTTPCTSLAASVRNCNTPVTANESTQKKTLRARPHAHPRLHGQTTPRWPNAPTSRDERPPTHALLPCRGHATTRAQVHRAPRNSSSPSFVPLL